MDVAELEKLGRWFEGESNAMVLYARQWLGVAAAEDAVQEVFLRLVASPRWPETPKAWLYRVVRNRALKSLRTDQRRMRREARVIEDREDWFEANPGEGLDARQAELALRGLVAEEREVVTLRIWGGLTFEEIAEVVEGSVATVFRRYRSGLEHLRNQLEATWTTKVS